MAACLHGTRQAAARQYGTNLSRGALHRIDEKSVDIVIDVRKPAGMERGHIAQAIHMPLNHLARVRSSLDRESNVRGSLRRWLSLVHRRKYSGAIGVSPRFERGRRYDGMDIVEAKKTPRRPRGQEVTDESTISPSRLNRSSTTSSNGRPEIQKAPPSLACSGDAGHESNK